jgi:hypothetical protein
LISFRLFLPCCFFYCIFCSRTVYRNQKNKTRQKKHCKKHQEETKKKKNKSKTKEQARTKTTQKAKTKKTKKKMSRPKGPYARRSKEEDYDDETTTTTEDEEEVEREKRISKTESQQKAVQRFLDSSRERTVNVFVSPNAKFVSAEDGKPVSYETIVEEIASKTGAAVVGKSKKRRGRLDAVVIPNETMQLDGETRDAIRAAPWTFKISEFLRLHRPGDRDTTIGPAALL